jgi:cysteine synthase A
MESNNPGGTGKDRAVQHMLDVAEQNLLLKPGMSVVEGTSGSTGISLAYQCKQRGYQLHIVMPDDQAQEKRILLERLGAHVTIVPSSSIANKNHYVNRAASMARDLDGFFVNQFENLANCEVHYLTTGKKMGNDKNIC